jgi:prepilin-type N-terminal cleavage/methylation domain-containing protein
MNEKSNFKGFTLIELLVVIAIIAILAVVVVLTLNPGQLLAQSRDSNRVSDMATLKSAIALYLVDQATTTLGTPGTVYAAYAGPELTTTNLQSGTSSAPAGWGYLPADAANLVTSTLRGVGGVGSGWLPIPFSNITSGAPFSSLPVDPSGTNSNSSCALGVAPCTYTYTASSTGQYKLAVKMESTKYNFNGGGSVVDGDGGNSTSTYEAGSNVNL